MTFGRRLAVGALAAIVLAAMGACENRSTRAAEEAPQAAMKSVSYTVSGRVSEIDYDAESLTLLGAERTSTVPFDSATMREIREGDMVTAHLTLTRSAGDRRAFDAPEGELAQPPAAALPPGEATLGRYEVFGEIKEIDAEDGRIALRAEAATLTLRLPPAAVREFEQGDQVTLRVAFTRGA